MEDGVGVHSPEFLQRKVERLKTALDEANLLMDRHVAERDDARAQIGSLKQENEELRRHLSQRESDVANAAAPVPEIEAELRARIAQLESEGARSAHPEGEQH